MMASFVNSPHKSAASPRATGVTQNVSRNRRPHARQISARREPDAALITTLFITILIIFQGTKLQIYLIWFNCFKTTKTNIIDFI